MEYNKVNAALRSIELQLSTAEDNLREVMLMNDMTARSYSKAILALDKICKAKMMILKSQGFNK
jgi:hypothetical protein